MSPETKSVIVEVKDGVVRVVLNKPPLNVLDIPTMRELRAAIDGLARRGDVKVVVVDHEGKAFSAGVDIKDHTPDKVEEMLEVFHGIFRALEALEPPTVAVVRGAALGGGCELATFCDLVVASEDAKLGQPEVKVGVFPPVAAVVLPRLLGRSRALEMILTGDPVDAMEADRIGLVSKVFPAEGFREKADAWIGRLASLSAPVLRLAKRAVVRGASGGFGEALAAVERIYLDELMRTEDAREGLDAFLEKRRPQWRGK
ncbi:MAG: enoyl-CoA hydratase/isomerase family protein [Planctomycetes bacterium]|nr:enoyl-CoA hydratase/isomerase family protein [Planctomycetota bacterium]